MSYVDGRGDGPGKAGAQLNKVRFPDGNNEVRTASAKYPFRVRLRCESMARHFHLGIYDIELSLVAWYTCS